MPNLTLDFADIGLADIPRVGGKNASLGQLFNRLKPLGLGVLDGFALTAQAYRDFLDASGLRSRLEEKLKGLNPENIASLAACGGQCRRMILDELIPPAIAIEIHDAYKRLMFRLNRTAEMAVRSSATIEDLPDASFAGQQETLLNVSGEAALLDAIRLCFASCFTDRAISYRARHNYDYLTAAVSVGVQPMVRSDKACSGIIFTLDPESGFRNVTVVAGSYGLGEYIVQGVVNPDEWVVFKPTLPTAKCPIIGRRLGSKEVRLVYSQGQQTTVREAVPIEARSTFCLSDREVLTLARWAGQVEAHYSEVNGRPTPMDLEWAKDGITGELFIVQARPETVHSARKPSYVQQVFTLTPTAVPPIVSGQAVGERIATGAVRIVLDPANVGKVQPGEILVAPQTDPDWEPVMKRIAAIVTDHGGRTAHAAIISRELGLCCVVGSAGATAKLYDGQIVTVSCAEGATGNVYPGQLPFTVNSPSLEVAPPTRTAIMLNVGDPAQAFRFSMIPNDGVGLARTEFIINSHIGIHPMALVRFSSLKDLEAKSKIAACIGISNPQDYFIERLSEGIAQIAAAFYPKPVVVRTSDFKTNEYAKLIGGAEFEPAEENPMLGFRGASRYYDPRYAEGFALECAAIAAVRNRMGLDNVIVMIPFCRTTEEAKRVLAAMAGYGLRQHDNGLQVYAMCEIPSNVLLADDFLRIFDGYSIGSNDLTQLTLGIDRDSGTVSRLFDERDPAVKALMAQAIEAAHRANKPIGICGQAPSDYPEFAAWLVQHRITSISLNPDTATKARIRIAQEESSRL
jgi:pyruvate,water dikinase